MSEFLPLPKNFTEAQEIAKYVAQSNLIPQEYRGKPADVLIAMEWSRNLGVSPIQGIQNIAVIKGKPSVYGDLLAALVYRSGLLEDKAESIAGTGENMYATCTVQRKGQKTKTAWTYSVEDAKRAGLWGKENYVKNPKDMLIRRARNRAFRLAFPDLLLGLGVVEEELEDNPLPGVRIVKESNAPLPKRKEEKKEPQSEDIVDVEDVEVVQESVQHNDSAPRKLSAAAFNLQVNQIKEAATYDDLMRIYRAMNDREKEEFMQFFSERKKELFVAKLKQTQQESPESLKASEPETQQATSTNELL